MKTYRILCFGDSLTEGWYEDGKKFYPYTVKLKEMLNKIDGLNFDVINRGKSSEIVSKEMIERLPIVLNSIEKPDLAIILGGTNDLENMERFREKSLSSEIFVLHRMCLERGIKTLALTLPEIASGYFAMTEEQVQFWTKTNQEIREFCQEKDNVYLCDLAVGHPMFNLSQEEKDNYWDDDIHYTPNGYDRMGEIIYEHIRKIL